MTEKKQTHTSQFIDFVDAHHSGELGSDAEENFQSELLDVNETDKKLNEVFVTLSKQLELFSSQ